MSRFIEVKSEDSNDFRKVTSFVDLEAVISVSFQVLYGGLEVVTIYLPNSRIECQNYSYEELRQMLLARKVL